MRRITRLLTFIPSLLLSAFALGCTDYETPPNKPKDPEPEYEIPEGQDKLSFRLMSFNIRESTAEVSGNEWSRRQAAVYRMFQDIKPDLVAFQELRREQYQYLKEKFGADYTFFTYAKDGKLASGRVADITDDTSFANGGQRQAYMIRTSMFEMLEWGRYWFSETPDKSSYSWDAGTPKLTLWLKIKAKATGKEFWIFNTHFFPSGDVGKLHCTLMSVERMKQAVGDTTKEGKGTNDKTIFFCADCNMEYADGQNRLAAMKDWMWHGNMDAPQRDDSKTYNGFRDNPATWTTIDHIFYRNAVNKGYKVVDDESKYGVRFISDHFPIYVDFEM